jgi:hypothetical protein
VCSVDGPQLHSLVRKCANETYRMRTACTATQSPSKLSDTAPWRAGAQLEAIQLGQPPAVTGSFLRKLQMSEQQLAYEFDDGVPVDALVLGSGASEASPSNRSLLPDQGRQPLADRTDEFMAAYQVRAAAALDIVHLLHNWWCCNHVLCSTHAPHPQEAQASLLLSPAHKMRKGSQGKVPLGLPPRSPHVKPSQSPTRHTASVLQLPLPLQQQPAVLMQQAADGSARSQQQDAEMEDATAMAGMTGGAAAQATLSPTPKRTMLSCISPGRPQATIATGLAALLHHSPQGHACAGAGQSGVPHHTPGSGGAKRALRL